MPKKEKNMTKNVEVTVDIKIAKRMLGVAGVNNVNQMTDDEIFEKVLQMNEMYGVKYVVKS